MKTRFDEIPLLETTPEDDVSERLCKTTEAYWQLRSHCVDEVLSLCLWRLAALWTWALLGIALLVHVF